MKLEIYPKPGVKTINGNLYSKETIANAVTVFNERTKIFGFNYIETSKDNTDHTFMSIAINAVGSIKNVETENGVYVAEYTSLKDKELTDDIIKTNDFVLLMRTAAIVDRNKNVEIKQLFGFYIVKRSEVEVAK